MFLDEFGAMLRQLPPALVFNICLSGTLLVIATIYFGYVRPTLRLRREREALRQEAQHLQMMRDGDLPDLLMLTDLPEEMQESDLEAESAPYEVPRAPQYAAAPVVLPTRVGGEVAVRLADGQVARASEVLAVLRDGADDRLIVQFNGSAYRSLSAEPDARQVFNTLMKELAESITRPDTPRPATEPPVIAQDAPRPAPQPRPAANVPPVTASGGTPGALPNYRDIKETAKPGGFLRPARMEIESVPELNLAGAIEAFLQHKLYQTGSFAGRSIHVHPAVGGGVAIEVDGTYYESIADVGEPDVRRFLQETIEEWQSQQQ